MPIVLPTKPLAATRINPRIMLIYSIPKVGKTEALTKLDSCLILDSEKGAETRASLRVPIRAVEGPTIYKKDEKGKDTDEVVSSTLDEVYNSIIAEAARQKAAGEPLRFPYRRIAMDTLDLIEDMCEVTATRIYKDSIIGRKFEGKSVLDLPNGGGYYHLRNTVIDQINRFAGVCETLILVCHVKEKMLNKGGIEVATNDLSLTGKIGGIVASKCDVIGFMYREQNGQLMINFKTLDAVMGARFPHLAGKMMPFDWDVIFRTPEQVAAEESK